ncbi:EthD family reductase [Streptomyces sp. ISL-12]|uniref:EthD domain-containing protein n=1 Tax=Streptomyces sp. ISL-12 TaxID=2819177 RepID=UPI001BE763BE|nr:EthD domain-containing protein [Streptomyces sp. ISL-12]MBT2412353.1 EthD family reductase [Streptomyces sp. ISL-12]
MIKFAFLINRAEGMSFESFVEHHRARHAPLFTSIPEARRYVRKYTVSHPVPAPAGNYPAPAYDGLTEIWFENWADHDAFFASANYRERVHPDEANFIDLASVAVMVTEERVVVEG